MPLRAPSRTLSPTCTAGGERWRSLDGKANRGARLGGIGAPGKAAVCCSLLAPVAPASLICRRPSAGPRGSRGLSPARGKSVGEEGQGGPPERRHSTCVFNSLARTSARLVSGLGVCPLLQQRLHDFNVAELSPIMQRSHIVLSPPPEPGQKDRWGAPLSGMRGRGHRNQKHRLPARECFAPSSDPRRFARNPARRAWHPHLVVTERQSAVFVQEAAHSRQVAILHRTKHSSRLRNE